MAETLNIEQPNEKALTGERQDVAMSRLEQATVMATEAMTANQIASAYRASLQEHNLGLRQAFSIYRKALCWTLVMGMVGILDQVCPAAHTCQAIIMEGYDREDSCLSRKDH